MDGNKFFIIPNKGCDWILNFVLLREIPNSHTTPGKRGVWKGNPVSQISRSTVTGTGPHDQGKTKNPGRYQVGVVSDLSLRCPSSLPSFSFLSHPLDSQPLIVLFDSKMSNNETPRFSPGVPPRCSGLGPRT